MGISTHSLLILIFSPSLSSSFVLHSPRLPSLIKCKHPTQSVLYSTPDDDTPTTLSKSVLEDANDALTNVGWAPSDDGEMTSDDPFVQQIDAQIRTESGVGLDELLNPAKVVNLERDLFNLRTELATLTNKDISGNVSPLDLTLEDCDGGGGGEESDALRAKITKKERDLFVERKAVFRGWLKNIFLGQAVLSLGLSWVMVTEPSRLFGSFDWFSMYEMDTSIRVLGFWWWWLFIVPSLRSSRPKGAEKKALDIAFIGTPLISILSPIVTKDTAIIWFANLAVVAGSYAFATLTDGDDDGDDKGGKNQPEWLKFVYKSLDVGSGRERGVRQ